MKHFQHIIWDWNGTLLDDAQVCVDILNEVLALYNKPTTSYEQYLRDFAFPVSDYYEQLGFDFTQESYDEVAQAYIDRYSQRQFDCQLHTGTRNVLVACQQQGLGQSILSAYQTKLLEQVVTHFGLRDFFSYLAGRDDLYAAQKIQQGKVLLAQINISPQQILLIGDTIHDFEVAREMNTDCVLISNGHQQPEKLISCGVPVLKSIQEIPNYVRNEEKSKRRKDNMI